MIVCKVALLLLVSFVQQPPAGTARPLEKIDVNGKERSYIVDVPTTAAGTQRLPLILAFHGLRQTAEQLAEDSALTAEVGAKGFILVYPSGSGELQGWDAGDCCVQNSEDVDFARKLVDEMIRKHNANKDRVYLVGMSNGAMMAYRLACEYPDDFAGVVAVAGPVMFSSCAPKSSIRVMHIHGTDDRIVPFKGGNGASKLTASMTFTSVEDTIKLWVKANKGSSNSVSVDLSNGASSFKVTETTYSPTDNSGERTVLVTVEDGGHLWPGRPLPDRYKNSPFANEFGDTTQTVSANELILDFFK